MSDVYAGDFFEYCAVLEDHMISLMRRWHIGAGLMGENVSESIHSYIAHLEDLITVESQISLTHQTHIHRRLEHNCIYCSQDHQRLTIPA